MMLAFPLPDERREMLHPSAFVEMSAAVNSTPSYSPPAFYREIFLAVRAGETIEITQDDLEELGGRIGCVAYWAQENGVRCWYDVMRRRLMFTGADSIPLKRWPRPGRGPIGTCAPVAVLA